MYSNDTNKIAIEETPSWWRKLITIDWFRIILYPAKVINSNSAAYQTSTERVVNHNAQTKTLEKYLNDTFPNSARGIYIENTVDLGEMYLHNKIELKPKQYIYNKWNAIVNYVGGNRIVWQDAVWEAEAPNTNQLPDVSPAFWVRIKDKPILRNKIEYDLQPDFIVFVPATLVFDQNRMKAEVNRMKLAGTTYIIQLY